MKSESAAIKRLINTKSEVSSHYLIKKNGEINSLVPDLYIAWHAGISSWKGIKSLNKYSIGIEITNPGHINNYKKFSKKQINSILKLTKFLIKKYKIQPQNILGHSDIAPYRKIDPGISFPWLLLEQKKLAFEIKKINMKHLNKFLIKKWYKKYNFSKKKILLFMLSFIGYDVRIAYKNKSNLDKIIYAYTSRFKHYNKNKKNIFYIVEVHFFNILLTKLKK